MKSFFNASIYTKTNNKIINNNSLLEFNLKGLNLYNKSLKSFISKYNFINLILNIKNNSAAPIHCLLPLKKDGIALAQPTVGRAEKNVNLNTLLDLQSSHNKINENKIYKIKLIKYLEKLSINNKFYIDNNSINYVKYIDYKNINTNYLSIRRSSTNLYDLLFNSFLSMNSLISKPVFEITNEKVKIHLFMYLFLNKNNKININNSFTKLNKLKLDILCQILSHIFNKPVQLELVRLYYPYFDSNIFVNLLSKIINIIQLRVIMKRFFKKAIIKNPIKIFNNNLILKIPSLLSGIKLRIGGRLLTQRIIPRKTVKTIRKGTLAKGKINFLDEARYTNKNKRGAFTLIISLGHYLTKTK
jgi:hypothetical protein